MDTAFLVRALMEITPVVAYGLWRVRGYTLAHTALIMCWVCMWVMALGGLGFETLSLESAAWAILSTCALSATNSRHAPKRDGTGNELLDWCLLVPFAPLLAWHHVSFATGHGAALWLVPEAFAAAWWCVAAGGLVAGALRRAYGPPPVAPPDPEQKEWRFGR